MTPKMDRIIDVIVAHNSFVISSHARPDGDSVGSQLALARALRTLGKTFRIVNHDAPPSHLGSLPDIDWVEVSDTATSFDAKVAIVLECTSLLRTEVDGLARDIVINRLNFENALSDTLDVDISDIDIADVTIQASGNDGMDFMGSSCIRRSCASLCHAFACACIPYLLPGASPS